MPLIEDCRWSRTRKCVAVRQWIARHAALLAVTLLWSAPVVAQTIPAISEGMLRDPWERAHAVLQTSLGSMMMTSADVRPQLGSALDALRSALSEYERQVDQVVDRIIGDPQFSYIADTTSVELAVSLAEVYACFDTLYSALKLRDREDARAAQASLHALRITLADKTPFERDVFSALGSGSRQQIIGLATRWWNGEERAIAVKKLVVEMRQQLDSGSGKDKSN